MMEQKVLIPSSINGSDNLHHAKNTACVSYNMTRRYLVELTYSSCYRLGNDSNMLNLDMKLEVIAREVDELKILLEKRTEEGQKELDSLKVNHNPDHPAV